MSAPYHQDSTVTLHHGDCLDVLRTLPDASVDAVVTDPPYGLGFMGKEWDDLPPGRPWAEECLRVLKPGGHLLAFGGTRTWHRLACAVEDAGFEVRDSIAWMYGSGFPKSMNVAKAITGTELGHGGNSGAIRRATMGADYEPSGVRGNRDGVTRRSDTGMADLDLTLTPGAMPWQGWGTALKPAFEPIVVARKPLAGTVAANVLAHGTGALNVDGCRVEADWDTDPTRRGWQGRKAPNGGMFVGGVSADLSQPNPAGRWPANVILDEDQAAELDAQSGEQRDGVAVNRNRAQGEKPNSIYEGGWQNLHEDVTFGASGGASRFFYVAKADASERVRIDGTAHPTVKPLALMRWLVRLVTPPGGVVLEPFAGSGTTVEACILEGFRCIAIEREADYLPLIVQRINRRRDPVAAVRATGDDGGLFDLIDGGAA